MNALQTRSKTPFDTSGQPSARNENYNIVNTGDKNFFSPQREEEASAEHCFSTKELIANMRSGLSAADNSSADLLPGFKSNNNSVLSKTFYCEECYFKDHESHSDNGSIKSMLTKEYQAWKALSDRPDQLKALWERNYSNYGHMVR